MEILKPKTPLAPKVVKPAAVSRLLTAKEMRTSHGLTGANPYLAGQNKWDINYKGVDLMTGNYTVSATDLTFEGGYGIPVNVTRAYSANSTDEGPYGMGWTLTADVRSTAGGVLKSSNAPVRSIPVSFHERPSLETDPNVSAQPVEAVVSEDAGGKEETTQRDADGLLTTPPWDKNVIDSTYELVTLNGSTFRVLLSNSTTTPDGTVYTYAKEGSYVNGTVPYNNSSATPEASNILKVTTATDRQGNVTTYTYGSGYVTFTKSNGQTSEHPLTLVQMPNGHTITFNWGSGATANRLTSVTDGVRTVTYGYTSGQLSSVTTPGGKTTSYGYGSSGWVVGTGNIATGLLTTITDPRGLQTQIQYITAPIMLSPYYVMVEGAQVYNVTQPNGVVLHFATPATDGPAGIDYYWTEYISGTGQVINSGGCSTGAVSNDAFTLRTYNFNALQTDNDVQETNGPTANYKTYSASTQDLLVDKHFVRPNLASTLSLDRKLRASNTTGDASTTVSTTTYNFMGNPLSKTTQEYVGLPWSQTAYSLYRTVPVGYSYWGKDKYYQQKAVKDQAGRYSYTDYYDNNASAGSRGQTRYVYSPAYAGFYLDTSITPPSGTPSGNYWKYQLKPGSVNNYSATFSYDSLGRATDVWKLQKATTTPWTYVQAHTTYYGNTQVVGGGQAWGAVASVIEDYGGMNRTTLTLAYNSFGVPIEVQDAKGQVFHTNFDADGLVQSVVRKDVTPNLSLVTYTYGTTGITNGALTSITDDLTGVSQSMSYSSAAGGSFAQVSVVTETNGSVSSSCSYTYSNAGEKSSVSYSTPNGMTSYSYTDYSAAGDGTDGSRIFQTLAKLDSSGNLTSEQFHYAYDSDGRLRSATFAMTPQNGQSGYSASFPAGTRARAWYQYDSGGRMIQLNHFWDTWSSGAYTSAGIIGNTSAYEIGGAYNRALKTQSTMYLNGNGTDYYDSYGYDANLDYLTSANHTVGGTTTSDGNWAYDAAGNRSDSTCDNLNRATTIGGVSRTYDILGNTLTIGSGTSMGWDSLSRMTSVNSNSYVYRADGMRVSKTIGSVTTRTAYDGQMPVEVWDGNNVTKNVLGARGIDGSITGSTISYPIYDLHGNNVATLTRSNSTFAIGNLLGFGPWGATRTSSQTGGNHYCASLGHLQDSETGFIYMRARYYESESGRFLSQDRVHDGHNWFVYCGNNPITSVDQSGQYYCNYVAGFKFIFDAAGGLQHMHIYDLKGNELWSGQPSGAAWHGEGSDFPAEVVQALMDASKSGDKVAKNIINRIVKGGFGIAEQVLEGLTAAISGIVIVAISSLDAYFQYNPADFMDIIQTIGTFGRG